MLPVAFVCKRLNNSEIIAKNLRSLTCDKGDRVINLYLSMNRAAIQGDIHLVQWYRNVLHVPLDSVIFESAAESGNLELVKWLHENHCPYSKRVFTAAEACGHLPMMEWLQANGYEREEGNVIPAPLMEVEVARPSSAEQGHMYIKEWMGIAVEFHKCLKLAPQVKNICYSDDDSQ